MKKYKDDERSYGKCYDCGLKYNSDAWCDVIVPDEVWEKINPTFHEGAGLLCFNCIANRCVEADLNNVAIKITSGPFRRMDQVTRYNVDDVDRIMAEIETLLNEKDLLKEE